MTDSYKIVIPVRYESTRLPGKPMADICGKPMIQHVYECAMRSRAEEVIIATDNTMIGMAAEDFGASICMTDDEHETGTSRIAEVVDKMGWSDDTVVVNLQGDEPMMPEAVIDQLGETLIQDQRADCASLCTPITRTMEISDPNIVKVVRDKDEMALYFSRSVIPFNRDPDHHEEVTYYRHIGMYAFRVSLLREFRQMEVCDLETIEKLEQLRLLYNGYRVHVATADEIPGPGVDTQEDLDIVRQLMAAS